MSDRFRNVNQGNNHLDQKSIILIIMKKNIQLVFRIVIDDSIYCVHSTNIKKRN